MKKILVALLVCLIFGSCEVKNDAEAQGKMLLEQARTEMSMKQFDKAKKIIKNLRDSVPFALNAREQAILLMDSINIAQAQEQLRKTDSLFHAKVDNNVDSLQQQFQRNCDEVKFFLRKLQHDKQNMKTYKD